MNDNDRAELLKIRERLETTGCENCGGKIHGVYHEVNGKLLCYQCETYTPKESNNASITRKKKRYPDIFNNAPK